MLRTETLKTGRPKDKPELKKLTSERIRALQIAQKTTPPPRPPKKRAGWKTAQVKSVKKSHSEERKEPYIRESNHTKY